MLKPGSNLSLQDVAALIVSVVLVVGVVVLAIVGKTIPSELATALGASMTWLFVRSASEASKLANHGP